MASTQPAPLTLLRVKRARAHTALDAVHVHLPKRARTEAPDTRMFRRLPAAADIDTLGPARVVDIDPLLLRKSHTQQHTQDVDVAAADGMEMENREGDTSEELTGTEILYNGVPLEREFVDDEYMYDIFAEERDGEGETDIVDGGNVAWVSGEDLPVFDWDSESEEERDESDEERSLDYPSTPEQSQDSAGYEDGWRERELRFCESDGEETEDGVEKFPAFRDGFSDDDGDSFDYEA